MNNTADEQAAAELKLFVDNDGDLYRQQTTSILKNLAKKKAAGTYKPQLAEKLFMYLCESGGKKYARQFGSGEGSWTQIFSKPTRELVARQWREEFDAAFASGEFDEYVPKKYQKPSKGSAEDADYRAGAEHAQLVASHAPRSAIEYMISSDTVHPKLPGKSRHGFIPEVAHLPRPKNAGKKAFKLGFITRLKAILSAMDGN